MLLLMPPDPRKKLAQARRRMHDIEFFEPIAAIVQPNSRTVFAVPDVQRNMQLAAHRLAPQYQHARLVCAPRLPRATAAGIIPSGVPDDADDEGGISGLADTRVKAGTMSHTLVAQYPTSTAIVDP